MHIFQHVRWTEFWNPKKDRSNSVHRRVPVDKYREYPYNYSYLRSAGGIDIWKMKRFPRIFIEQIIEKGPGRGTL